MSTLTLVRHGQASYMSQDYDRLSPLGEEQARLLGDFWVRHQLLFDYVFCGPAKRHIRSMELAGQQLTQAGLPFPAPVFIPEFDEFDGFQLMKALVPTVRKKYPDVDKLYRGFEEDQSSPEAGRILQKVFEEVARHWTSGEFDVPEVETWANFRTRIASALDQVQTTVAKSSSSVVFTSGGPIAATIAQALNLAPRKAIEFVWLSRNCSWSEFYFSGDRFSLGAFNSFPHLDHRDLLTYR